MLNHAFQTMKWEKHAWLQNIKYYLYKHGLGDIWSNCNLCNKNSLKSVLTDRLQDIYMQSYYEYISSNTNEDKCKITQVCVVDSPYKVKEYLETINAPDIRSIFTKFRIDINNTMDCKIGIKMLQVVYVLNAMKPKMYLASLAQLGEHLRQS